jgi:hypothetical protein
MWSRGKKLISATSPELGVGVVLGVDGDYVEVFFPDADKHLRLSTVSAGIEPIELTEGDAVQLQDGSITTIERITGPVAVLADGSESNLQELWPHLEQPTLVDHLADSKVDPLLDVLNRVDGQRVLNARQRVDALSLVGARVPIVDHQVWTARRMLGDPIVRWLLADEPGLGRMVVACMVAAAMLRAGRVERVVIVAPHRRAIQWLAALYKRFHQVFVHIDHERWRDVKDAHGIDANPFEVHPLCVVSSGILASEEVLLEHLRRATPDLAVLDEAHQAFNYLLEELLLPMARDARHALVLAGPPEQIGESSFTRLVEALGLPDEASGPTRIVERVSALTAPDSRASEQRTGWSFPDTYDASNAPDPLEGVGSDFDETLRRFCLDAAEEVELRVEKRRGRHVYYFEYGPQVKVDSIPGLRAGRRFLGTFDRQTALDDESLDFFVSGHPLVEGLLAELHASSRGRVGAVRLRRSDAEGFHGLYLLVVEGVRDQKIRLIPLMDATGAGCGEERARALYAALDMGIQLDPERVATLMGRVAHHPLLEGLDARTLSQAILVAVMDVRPARE